MKTSNFSLPLLPESIAVGLSEDMLQYFIELKFLLLFFNKPVCVFANQGFQFLDKTAIDDLRKGRKTKTSVWEDEATWGERGRSGTLTNLDTLRTDEWDEVMAHCVPQYFTLNFFASDEPAEDEDKADYVFSSSNKSAQDVIEELAEPNLTEKEWENLFAQYLIRMNTRILIDVLELCCKNRIPMIWGDPGGVIVSSHYSKYLLDKYSQDTEDDKTAAFLRTLKGDELLRSIFELGVINVATVPVHKITEFKKNNGDLLENFLVSYRSFLTELQLDPLNHRKLVLSRTQKITEELNAINNELLILRKSSKYKWLENMSEAVFESAKSGALIALWNLLASPALLVGELGKGLLSAANFGFKDLHDKKQQEQAFIFRSSSGYLWKAGKEFSKSE